MTKQERIFDAIGGADELLLARSERSARRPARRRAAWAAAMAVCLVLLLWGARPKAPEASPDAPNIDVNIWDEGPASISSPSSSPWKSRRGSISVSTRKSTTQAGGTTCL